MEKKQKTVLDSGNDRLSLYNEMVVMAVTTAGTYIRLCLSFSSALYTVCELL